MSAAAESVIGLDCSTTTVKALAFDRDGNVLAEGRAAVPFGPDADGRFEQNPEEWWHACCGALAELASKLPGARIAAMAVANQRETIAPLDAAFKPVRKAILWLDGRASGDAKALADRLGSDHLHRITGKVPDPNPALYKLAWMRRAEPDLLDASKYFAEVHGYLVYRLTGRFATSTACADPLGVFDLEAKDYAADLLSAVGLSPGRFAPAFPPGSVLGHLTDAAARATGLPPSLPVVAGAGDGQAAGLGVNLMKSGRAYLNLGTAVVSGLRSDRYRVGRSFRTMISADGDAYVLETSLRSGTLLCDWLVSNVFGGSPCTIAALAPEAALVPPGSAGVMLLPYFLGVMTPHWDSSARGALVGLAPHHGRAHLLRALFEGIAMEQAEVMAMIRSEANAAPDEIVAIGGGAQSDLWCSIFADVLALPLLRSATLEASSLGAAMAAAVGAGWFNSFTEAASAMEGPMAARFDPDPARACVYARLRRQYAEIYARLRGFPAASGDVAEQVCRDSSSSRGAPVSGAQPC
jgi:xylulokinase